MTEPRALPASRPAERQVLGMAMVDGDYVIPVCQGIGLTADDFHADAHGALWALLARQHAEEQPTEMAAVLEVMLAEGHEYAESMGGAAYVSALPDHVASTESAEFYAGIVRQKAAARRAIALTQEAQDSLYAGADPVEVLTRLELQAVSLAATSAPTDWIEPADRVAASWAKVERRIEDRAVNGDRTMGWGIPDLDRSARFVEPDLVTVLARPGVGKTSLLRQGMRHLAEQGIGVAFVSMEATASQNDEVMAGGRAGVSPSRIREGLPGDDGRLRAALEHELGALSKLPIYIDDTPKMSPEAIYAKLRRLKSRHPHVRVAFIDYLGLIAAPWEARSQSRALQLDAICYAIKGVAKRLDMAVVLACQLNRNAAGSRPKPEDARGGDGPLNASDTMLALHDPDGETELGDRPTMGRREVIRLKARWGVRGVTLLDFHGPSQTLYEVGMGPGRAASYGPARSSAGRWMGGGAWGNGDD